MEDVRAQAVAIQLEETYEPPMLVEIGDFADITRGKGGPISDYPYWSRGYWLI